MVITPSLAYNTYYNGHIKLSEVRVILNSIPYDYFKGLDNLYLYEGICFENPYLYGWYEWERTTNSIYLCQLNRYDYDGDEYELTYWLLHELGHHFQVTVLNHKELDEEFAKNWCWK